jgi:hypothetical protein
LLKWCRVYGGREARDLRDVPHPVLERWIIDKARYLEIERLENAKYGGFVDGKQVEANILMLKRAYGFLKAQLDPDFAKWRQAALKSRATGPPDDQKMPGHDLTFGEGRKRTLRAKVREACARLHGVTACQTKK